MRSSIIFLFIFFSACPLPRAETFSQISNRAELAKAARTYPFRIWVDNTGMHQTVAKYLRHDKQNVTIMKENKLVLLIPFSRLSKNDHNYVEVFGKEIGNAAKPTKAIRTPVQEPIPNGTNTQAGTKSKVASVAEDELPRVDLTPDQQRKITHEGLRKPLAQKKLEEVRETLNQLMKGWPKEPTDELVDAVVLCTKSGTFSIDETALLLLLKSDPKSHFAVFEKAVERPDFGLRKIAYTGLAAINDDLALKVFLRKFDSDDNVYIGTMLPKFGSRAELGLHEHLNHIEPDHVLVTVSILSKVGTKLSVPILTSLAKDSEKVAIRQQAATALKQIEARSASSERE